jgi:hypothetical protein
LAEDSEKKGHCRNQQFSVGEAVISCGLCLYRGAAQIFTIFKPGDSKVESSDSWSTFIPVVLSLVQENIFLPKTRSLEQRLWLCMLKQTLYSL